MIRYALRCADNHGFDSWFQNSAAFEKLRRSGQLSCPTCGATDVDKAVMAPPVASKERNASPNSPDTAQTIAEGLAEGRQSLVAAPSGPVAEAIARLRDALDKHSENVGSGFAREARAIHDGEAPARAIHGEANVDEARALVEDGVPVVPLPFLAGRKVN